MMYVTLAVHHPKGPKEESVMLDEMSKFAEVESRHEDSFILSWRKLKMNASLYRSQSGRRKKTTWLPEST